MNFLPKLKSTLIGLAALIVAPGVASADQFALMDRVEGGTGAEVMLGAIIVEDADGLGGFWIIAIANTIRWQSPPDD